MPDIDKSVCQALEAAAVVADAEIALLQAVKILQSVDGALGRIVEEETPNSVPGGEGRRTTLEHHVTNRLGNGEVDPRDDAMVDLGPLDVELPDVGVDGAVDMVEETELAEGKFKKGAPGGVIGFMEIQNLWHMVADVQHLDSVGGERSWSSDMERIEFMCCCRSAGGGGGRRDVRHGREMEGSRRIGSRSRLIPCKLRRERSTFSIESLGTIYTSAVAMLAVRQ
jgi:hypothetical protein